MLCAASRPLSSGWVPQTSRSALELLRLGDEAPAVHPGFGVAAPRAPDHHLIAAARQRDRRPRIGSYESAKKAFSVISGCLPSGSSGPERQEARFRFLARMYRPLAKLKAELEFVLMGDVNIAHHEIDLKNWHGNQKNSGSLPEERRVAHEGQTPRRLPLNVSSLSWPRWPQRSVSKQCAGIPHSRKASNSSLPSCGKSRPRRPRPARRSLRRAAAPRDDAVRRACYRRAACSGDGRWDCSKNSDCGH